MNILLIGSGGREHALAWSLADSPLTSRLVIAPGNPGMEAFGEMFSIAIDDFGTGYSNMGYLKKLDVKFLGLKSSRESQKILEKTMFKN